MILAKPLSVFSLTYLVLFVSFIAVIRFFEVQDASSLSIPMLIVAALVAVKVFFKDNDRAFTVNESRLISLYSLFSTWLIMIISYTGLVALDAEMNWIDLQTIFSTASKLSILVVVVVVSFLHYVFLLFAYGFLSKWYLKGRGKGGKKDIKAKGEVHRE